MDQEGISFIMEKRMEYFNGVLPLMAVVQQTNQTSRRSHVTCRTEGDAIDVNEGEETLRGRRLELLRM